MSPEAEARKPNYTTFHSSVSNWNNSTQQWEPLCETTLPYYFVLAQCFHKFSLGAEPSAVFFQGLHSRVPFLRSCCSALFFPSAARPFSPSPPQPWLACGSAGRSLYWKNVRITGTFSTPLGPNVLCIWPRAAFWILWWGPPENHAVATSSRIMGYLYIIAIVITCHHSSGVMYTPMSLD